MPARSLPSTSGWPLIGSLPYIAQQNIDFFTNARQRYGDIYTLNLGITSILMVNTPEAAQYILRDQVRNFRKGGAMWDSIRSLLGNGLVVSEGDFWMRQRRMMQPHFHRQYLEHITGLMLTAIDEGMQSCASLAQAGDEIDILPVLNPITMKVIVQTMFSKSLSTDDMTLIGSEMAHALDFILQNMLTQSLPQWLPVPGRKRYQLALKRIDTVIQRVIKQRRQTGEQEADILGLLLQLVDEETGEAMTDQQLRDEIATLFLAGYETTALALAWVVHHLVGNPTVVQRLTEEVDSVLGQQSPTSETLMQLTYTRMVLQEALRLHPPAFWIPRTAIKDDEIDGYPIRAGQMVGISVYNIHRHPDIWPQPERFEPERFTPENSKQRHSLAWLPFGAGQRLCLGRDFALMEGTLVIARMIQQYKLIPTDRVAREGLSASLRPKNGIWVRLASRS